MFHIAKTAEPVKNLMFASVPPGTKVQHAKHVSEVLLDNPGKSTHKYTL